MRLKVENNAFRILLAFGFPNVKYKGTNFLWYMKQLYMESCEIIKQFIEAPA